MLALESLLFGTRRQRLRVGDEGLPVDLTRGGVNREGFVNKMGHSHSFLSGAMVSSSVPAATFEPACTAIRSTLPASGA